jgi:hypothetical protein
MALQEAEIPKVAQFLSHTNKVINICSITTEIASATTVAGAQTAVLGSAGYAAAHEADKRVVERWLNQALPRANALGIGTIANWDTAALIRSDIILSDPRLPTNYEASLEDD